MILISYFSCKIVNNARFACLDSVAAENFLRLKGTGLPAHCSALWNPPPVLDAFVIWLAPGEKEGTSVFCPVPGSSKQKRGQFPQQKPFLSSRASCVFKPRTSRGSEVLICRSNQVKFESVREPV